VRVNGGAPALFPTAIALFLVVSAFAPMAANERLCADGGDLLSDEDATLYRSLLGGLQYLTLTCPYLSFSVNRVCQ
jgi:hypothetical protein